MDAIEKIAWLTDSKSIAWLNEGKSNKNVPRICVALVLSFIVWVSFWHHPTTAPNPTPLLDKYVAASIGLGGRWFIPRSWYDDITALQPYPELNDYMDLRNPRSPAEGAHQALELALRKEKFIAKSKIPLLLHQTWKDCDSNNWKQSVRESVNAWIAAATGEESTEKDYPQMAYILWDDSAVERFFALYEPDLWDAFNLLPHPVEKSDMFRVAVLKWFGGVYVDLDTFPLQHPSVWIHDDDVKSWKDAETGKQFELHKAINKSYVVPPHAPQRPHPYPDSKTDYTPASYLKFMVNHSPQNKTDVAVIIGIEADTRPDEDQYWRAGYTYPVQLTNWAFAMAPQHPLAIAFLKQMGADILAKNATIEHEDPLDITGPPALTKAVKAFTEKVEPGFRWESVTGLNDIEGGRGKITAGDILVLPITGFSPGRGSRNNMGSQPIGHPNARLLHAAQGSWRSISLKVEAGKVCRTLFGLCRDWKKGATEMTSYRPSAHL